MTKDKDRMSCVPQPRSVSQQQVTGLALLTCQSCSVWGWDPLPLTALSWGMASCCPDLLRSPGTRQEQQGPSKTSKASSSQGHDWPIPRGSS